MSELATFSAAKLVLVYNAVTTDKPVKKFESQPRALERTLAELNRLGLSEADALAKLNPAPAAAPAAAVTRVDFLSQVRDILTAPAAPRTVTDAVSGETLPRPASVHGRLRLVEGSPEKAARVVADQAVVALRATYPAPAAPAPVKAPEAAVKGPLRTNATVPQMVAAMRAPGGATLAQLTVVSGWGAPVEVRNLRIMAAKVGFELRHDGVVGEDRRYRAE